VAALVRRFGAERLDRIEDAVQDAMAAALERWERGGDTGHASGDSTGYVTGWLVRVAYNRVIDAMRGDARLEPLAAGPDGEPPAVPHAPDAPHPAPALDDELALMFLCCHPTLPRAAQVALTLKIASGLSTAQIARAFVTDERTVAQRIVRAKQRLREEGARFELPEIGELPARVGPILDVLYLVFAEGHTPSDGDSAVKDEMCAEALRLARLLVELPGGAPPAADALRALLCFQASRAAARTADDGGLLLLHEQDRSRWDGALVAEGFAALARSARGSELTRFHLEAAIAACHAAAPRHDATDWPQIVSLYDALREVAPSPVIEVNRAVAVGMARGALAGLDELDAIPERELLARYPYALAAYAEMHASLGSLDEARGYLRRALDCQSSRAQCRLLERKLRSLAR
jgi:RNA polymerase sigma-70 factor (ECF subfamily)